MRAAHTGECIRKNAFTFARLACHAPRARFFLPFSPPLLSSSPSLFLLSPPFLASRVRVPFLILCNCACKHLSTWTRAASVVAARRRHKVGSKGARLNFFKYHESQIYPSWFHFLDLKKKNCFSLPPGCNLHVHLFTFRYSKNVTCKKQVSLKLKKVEIIIFFRIIFFSRALYSVFRLFLQRRLSKPVTLTPRKITVRDACNVIHNNTSRAYTVLCYCVC